MNFFVTVPADRVKYWPVVLAVPIVSVISRTPLPDAKAVLIKPLPEPVALARLALCPC